MKKLWVPILAVVAIQVAFADQTVLELTPDSLREHILAGNNSILMGLNQVYTAKDQRTKAMTSLLPSINLGAVLGTTVSGPTFLLSSVSFLLPFLVPNNWINLEASKEVLNAQMASYRVLELNQYASAYALYEAVMNDLDAEQALKENYEILYKLYLTLELNYQQNGSVTLKDVLQAKEKSEAAYVPYLDMQKVIAIDTAALRHAMGLDESVTLNFSTSAHVPASDSENQDLQSVLNAALEKAPENSQLQALLNSALDSTWSAVFGFVTGSTLGTLPPSSGASTPSFSNLIQNQQVGIGFGYAPAIQLTNDSVDAVKLQIRDLGLQEQEIIESALSSVAKSQKQLQSATAAKKDSYQVFMSELLNYQMGSTDLLHVLQAESDYAAAQGLRIQSQAALDNVRITLHRALLSDQFSPEKIQGCQSQAKTSSVDPSFLGWLKGIFSPSTSRVTIDQMCRQSPASEAPAT